MQRLIKFIVITLVVIIVGVSAISIFLTTFVDPNQYKDRIATLINEKTGYQVALNGSITWALFPSVGISVEDIHIKAKTDSPTPFMTLKQATINVKLLPLLDKQIQMDAVSVDGLSMTLSVDQRGNGNWQNTLTNISNKKINTPAPTAEVINTLASTEIKKPTSDMSIDIATIDVSHAEIIYEDARTQQNIKITNLSLVSNDITSTSTFPIKIAFDINALNPAVNGHVDINSDVLVNTKDGVFNFTNLLIQSSLNGNSLGEKTVPLSLTGNATIDNNKQKIMLSKIVFDFSNMKINTNIEYNMRNGEYKGDLSIPAFDLNTFRESITQSNNTQSLPPTKLALDGIVAGNQQYIFLNNIELLLNDIPLTARVGMSSFANHTLDITANGNQVDLEALLTALGKDARMSGILTFSTHLTTNGSNDDIIKNINGNGQFDISNATLKSENLTQKLCDAIATLNKTESSQSRGTDTHFDALKGSFTIQNGVIRSPDLTAQMKGANAKAQATSDMLQKTINANIGVTVIGDSDDVACSVNEKFQNIALPITCKGTYDTEPGKMCSVDKDGLANIAKSTLIEKATQKLEDKYGPGVKGALDKLFGN